MSIVSKTLVAFVALLIVPTAVSAQAPVTLKWKFAEGQKLGMKMDQQMDMEMNVGGTPVKTSNKSEVWTDWHVTGVTDEYGEITTKITRIKINSTGGPMAMSIDTDDKNAAPGPLDSVRKIIDAPVKQQMEFSGKQREVAIPDAIGAAAGPQGKQMLESLGMNSNLQFPEKPLSVGDTWSNKFETPSPAGNMKVENTYTYKGTQETEGKTLHRFDVILKMEFLPGGPVQIDIANQKTAGYMLFDAEAGRLDRSVVNQEMDMVINAAGNNLTQKLKSKINVKFTEAK